MWIKQRVSKCDFTDREYESIVDGAGAVTQGNSGRWCVVMWAGPEYIEEHRIDPLDSDEAWEKLWSKYNNADALDRLGWRDF